MNRASHGDFPGDSPFISTYDFDVSVSKDSVVTIIVGISLIKERALYDFI